jgi:membrane protease YdiL (CAAX protease family)
MQSPIGYVIAMALFMGALAFGGRFYLQQFLRIRDGFGKVNVEALNERDIALAVALTGWFAFTVLASLASEKTVTVSLKSLVEGTALFAGIVAAILATLKIRGADISDLFGLRRMDGFHACGLGVAYLLAAVPLLLGIGMVVQMFAGPEVSSQETVRFFTRADSASVYWMIGASVVVAPMAEEFIFRGYLYGVAKRYLGAGWALGLTSLLFGAVHLHGPTFPILTLLAICLAISYESTGSLLVPMALHSTFNAIQLTAITFFPHLVQ